MSSNDSVRTCEDLLASLSAAETHLRVFCSLQMEFGDVLDVYRSTASMSRELLSAVGIDPAKVYTLSELGGRDNTDELLDLAVLGALGDHDTDERTRRVEPLTPAQDAGNAPSIAYDDGPEGTADDSAPLLTDEESVELSDHGADLVEYAEVSTPLVTLTEQASEGDVMVMEEDDWDDDASGPDMKATDVMSLADAQALVRAAVEAEESGEETEPQGLLREIDDNEKTVIASADTAFLIDDEPSETEITRAPSLDDITEPKTTPLPVPKVKKPRVKASPSSKSAKAEVATNFYAASAAIPTIRDDSTAKPRAAAIRLGSDGTSAEVLGADDEDEPIAIGGVEDEDELDMDSEGGLTLELEDEWDDDAWEDDDDEAEEELMELGVGDLEVVDEEEPLPELASLTDNEVTDLIARAQKAAHQGNYEAGVNYYSDVLDADPDHAGAYLGRGRLYLDRLDYSRAMSDFTVAEDLAPEDPEIQVAFGDLYFARKDYRKAIEHFDAALEIKEDHAMAFCRRGISHYYRRNYKVAFGDLEQALKLDPEIPNIRHWHSQAKKKAARSK